MIGGKFKWQSVKKLFRGNFTDNLGLQGILDKAKELIRFTVYSLTDEDAFWKILRTRTIVREKLLNYAITEKQFTKNAGVRHQKRRRTYQILYRDASIKTCYNLRNEERSGVATKIICEFGWYTRNT